jgi:hypothetical protein
MTRDTDPLTIKGVLREHRFESRTPVLGPLIVRLRTAWYNVAARWGDQSIISQQVTCNQTVAQQIAEHDQRLIVADRDLTELTRTVAELTQQVIELSHTVEELQATRSQT